MDDGGCIFLFFYNRNPDNGAGQDRHELTAAQAEIRGHWLILQGG